MGGYVYPIRPGFPDWGNGMDWNIQVDVRSARHVIENSNPVLIPLTVTVETALRRSYLEDLENAGPLGQLLARQAEAFAVDEQNEKRIGETCEACPMTSSTFFTILWPVPSLWDTGKVLRSRKFRSAWRKEMAFFMRSSIRLANQLDL